MFSSRCVQLLITMFIFYTYLVVLINNVYSASTVDYLQHPLNSCNVGDTVRNECNECVCTSKAIFECTSLNCNDTNFLQEDVDAICHPNQLYTKNLISCICTKDGRWPHKSCHDTFQTLPSKNVIKHKCEPNTYVVIDCNVCKCGPYGEILKEQCTKNVCDNDHNRRMSNKPSNVYGNCEIRNWYSLAPCQFCLCTNENRLVCNTGNHYSKKLELGSYSLVVCGKEFIKEAMELIPDTEKALRLGIQNDEHKQSTTTTHKIHTLKHIDINNKSYEKDTKHKDSNNDDEEYSSDSDEDNSVHTSQSDGEVATKEIGRTQNPYQEGDVSNNENDNDNDYEPDKKGGYEEDSSNEIPVEIEVPPTVVKPDAAVLKAQLSVPKVAPNAKPISSFSDTMKINLPEVLSKVFRMALRKSMVSLNSDSKCLPGTTTVNECNMCFCMRNSKLLCTNNPCK